MGESHEREVVGESLMINLQLKIVRTACLEEEVKEGASFNGGAGIRCGQIRKPS